LIVVSVLTVMGIMGVAFAFSMYLETQATRQFVSTTQARYLAEGGVSFARALLDEDRLGSRVDETGEAWFQALAGNGADLDGDGAADAKWWPVEDAAGDPAGRYAVQIADESGKVNLNAALAEPPPVGIGAINLTTLLQEAKIREPGEAARAIEAFRYGDDERPGIAGVDDDGDGAIDEPDEYQPAALSGDDRRVEGLEELAGIAGLDPDELRRLSQLATVYSWDMNVSVTGQPRMNVNTATAAELLSVLLDAGVKDPWQAAVNMADFVDEDVDLSRVTKAAQRIAIPNQGPMGAWEWSDDPYGHYETDEPGGEPLSWTFSVGAGTYRVLVRGVEGIKVGDVTFGGQFKPSVDDGESLGKFELTGQLAIKVEHRGASGSPCAIQSIELVSETGQGGAVVRGIEAVRINELMVEPSIGFAVSSAAFSPQGSDWGCPIGSDFCINSGVGQGRWTWSSQAVRPGWYYVRVFGTAPGQTVGEVRVETHTQLLVHGQAHPTPISVGSDGKINLAIGKTAAEGTYYLQGIELSLQPDGEYAELINLSDDPVDVSGWTIEGELAGGRQAKLPSGSVIAPHGLLVAAVDLDDSQTGLGGNRIDARSIWEIPEDANAVQLEFAAGSPSPDDDWLKAALPGGTASRLMLRASAQTVDEVEYALPAPPRFQSLEKGDPTVVADQDLDGIDEGWYVSLSQYTPGLPNDNDGLKELSGLEVIEHDPAEESVVLSRRLGGVGELAGLPSGKAWKPFASADLAKIVDLLTVEGLRLEVEGRLSAGQEAWVEQADGYAHNSTAQPPVPGQWSWASIPDGRYRLSLYGWSGEQLAVRWQRKELSFTDWSPGLTADAQGRLVIGELAVGMEETPPNTLVLEARCEGSSGICHLDYVQLDPQLIRVGPVNINTAPLGVLRALPGMTDPLASRIIAGRPYGDQDQKARGIGDLLIGEVFGTEEEEKLEVFRRLAHLITTRSDMFHIVSLGQAMQDDRVEATQRIFTVVQR
jgi:type II secretory pathway component PulK